MRIAISMLTLVLGVTGYAVYAGAESPTAAAPSTAPSADAPINKFCAVEGGDHEVDPKVFVMHEGKKVGFCCAGCVPDFNKDPAKYMKNLK